MKSEIEGLSLEDFIQIGTDQDNSEYIIKVSNIIDRYEKGIGAPNKKSNTHWNSDVRGVSAGKGIPLWMKNLAIDEIPFGGTKKSWIVRGSSDKFDIDKYLIKEYKKITWEITKYSKDIHINDEVFFWIEENQKKQRNPGIIARGTIISKVSNQISFELYEINRGIGMLKKEEIKSDPILKNLKIMKNAKGTIFPLSHKETGIINELWKHGTVRETNDSKLGNMHPRTRLMSIREIERSEIIVELTKKRANSLCEVSECPQVLFKKPDGKTYVEVHHLIKLSDGGPDTPDNTVCLCPHHHREIHYGENSKKLTDDLTSMRMKKD